MKSNSPSPLLFTGSRRETFLALAARVVPNEGPLAPGAGSDATLDAAERLIASLDEPTRRNLCLLLGVLEWGAAFKFGKRFTRLHHEEQEAYLRAWECSRLQLFRFGFSSLRNLALLSFYTRQESWPMIGYPGPVLEGKTADPPALKVRRTDS
jgi:hypothetical protein